MDQLVNVNIDKVHTAPQRALNCRPGWVKPGSWGKPTDSLCLEYLRHVYQHLYQKYY